MKPFLFLLVWLLLSCRQGTPEPIDHLTQTAWCNSSMTYRFGSDGSFEMKKYVGEFDLAGTTLTTAIRGDKTLFLLMPGQPECELVFVGKDKFSIKKLSGYSVQFEVNNKGEAATLTTMQPNGNFKATKKVDKAITELKK